METVLGDYLFDMLLIYPNDILVFSSDFESHLEKLHLVLSQIKGNGLKLKPSKCYLLRTEVQFLGHIVSAEGVGWMRKRLGYYKTGPHHSAPKMYAGY